MAQNATATKRFSNYALAFAFLAPLPIVLIAAIITSKLYWGYVFAPRSPEPRAVAATQIRSLSLVKVTNRNAVPFRLAVDTRKFEARVPSYRIDGYRTTILGHLLKRGVPWKGQPQVDQPILNRACDAFEKHVTLWPNTTGYTGSRALSGVAMELTGADGEKLIVLALSSDEVSNDHYAFYEVTFVDGGAVLRHVSTRRYFFDVAGIEGMELAAFFFLYAMPAICWMMLLGVVVATHGAIKRGREKRRHVCVCGYLTKGLPGPACPECGRTLPG